MRKNEEKLGDLIQALIGQRHIQANLDRIAIENIWKQHMGPMINRYTRTFSLRSRTTHRGDFISCLAPGAQWKSRKD